MFKRVIIQDFFSFKGEHVIDLNPRVNILLGINGSGKTAFINAFKLLTEGIVGKGIEEIFQTQWGGFTEVVNANGAIQAPCIRLTFVFDPVVLRQIDSSSPFMDEVYYSIAFSPSGTSYQISERLYTPSIGSQREPFLYLDFKNGNGRLSRRDTEKNNIFYEEYASDKISGQELVLRQITDPSQYLPSFIIRKAIESMSTYESFDTGSQSPLRNPTAYSSQTKLDKTGYNLPSLLNNLKKNNTFAYDKIEKSLFKINPAYRSIELSIEGGSRLYLSLREKNLNRTIGALHLSDGTLHFILLMAILHNPNMGKFVGIDEPETGLHPDMIKSICDMIKDVDSQIILATHSPMLLNQFELADILVFSKNENNETEVSKVNEDMFADLEGSLLPGQLWLQGHLGGVRW